MSHLKYPYLELKSPKFEYFLFPDFKDYPRTPNPIICRTFRAKNILSSVNYAS